MVATSVAAVLPGATWRAIPARHPCTTAGRQIDVLVDDNWLELAECGFVAPHLFERAGLDAQQWSDLALGMGLDRALMLRKESMTSESFAPMTPLLLHRSFYISSTPSFVVGVALRCR